LGRWIIWKTTWQVAKDPSLQVIPVVVLTAAERAQVPGAVEETMMRAPEQPGARWG
jgi:hypothetical protein